VSLKSKHTVEDLFEVASGSTPSTSVDSYWSSNGSGIKWITPKDLSALENSYISTTERKITKEGLNSCSARLIPKGSIILSSRAPIGYVAVMEDEMACNQGCKALIPRKPQEVDPLYFYYLFLTKEKELNNLGSGSTFKELSKTKLEEFKIEVHDIKEQKKIADQLDQADKARQQRKVANALTDQFLQSSFLSLFGDPVKNEKGWELDTVRNLAEKYSDGPFGSNLKTEHYTSTGVRIIRLQNIGVNEFKDEVEAYVSLEHYETIKKHSCYPGDVLIGTMGEPNLRACILPSSIKLAINKADCVLFRPNNKKVLAEYVSYLLNIPSFVESVANLVLGQTRGRISMGRLANAKLPVPPLSLQQQFASIVAQAEQLRQKQRESERELEQLFQSLLQRYFG
jgi:type I restriction enzyme, S subunit